MAKYPAVLWYPGDYLSGTQGMSFEEKGAYFELLMLQFNRGHMTSHMIAQTVGQLWGQIKDKFMVDSDGLFYNKRLDEEKMKREAFTKSRFNNKNGANQHTKEKKEDKGHTTSHMEDEDEDINTNNSSISSISLNKEKNNFKNEKRNQPFGEDKLSGTALLARSIKPKRPLSDFVGEISLEGKVIK